MSFEKNQDVADKMISKKLKVNFQRFSENNTVPKIPQQPAPDYLDRNESESEDLSEIPSIKLRRKSSAWFEEIDNFGTVTKLRGSDETVQSTEASDRTLLLQLQQGIRVSLDKLRTYPERDLLMTDFSFIEENHFSKQGPNISDFKFTLHVFAPVAFRYFRELFGICTEDFRDSICGSRFHYVYSNSKSGSAFFATGDDHFILKTVQRKEAKFLTELFPGYFLNLTQHTKTLLPKYYGLFSLISGVKTIRLVIMNNILPLSYNFIEKYDLKGSTYFKRQHDANAVSHNITLKDLDFLKNWPNGFYLPCKVYKLLLKSIERDCTVLESYCIMDYSLLLGIVFPDDSDSTAEEEPAERYERYKNLIGPFEARTMKGKTVHLFMGIIDILQSFTWKKKMECHLKSIFYSRDTISVNSPGFYARRFQNFLTKHVFKLIPTLVPSTKKENWNIERSTAAGF